jgi:hypothetical protein
VAPWEQRIMASVTITRVLGKDQLNDARSCLQLLVRYAAQFDEVMRLYAGRTLQGEQRKLATLRLKALKDSLEAENTRLRSADRDGRLSDVEKRFYYPAIHASYIKLSPLRWDAIPNTKWHATLYNSRIDLMHYLHALKSVMGM